MLNKRVLYILCTDEEMMFVRGICFLIRDPMMVVNRKVVKKDMSVGTGRFLKSFQVFTNIGVKP